MVTWLLLGGEKFGPGGGAGKSVENQFTHAPLKQAGVLGARARVRRPPAAHAPLVGGSFGSGCGGAGRGLWTQHLAEKWKESRSGAG